MKETSFGGVVPAVLKMDDFLETIPLPTDLPKAPDLSRYPAEVLRSSAVDSLITQNADLMARLTVHLKKNSLLESKLSEFEQENRHLRHKFNSARDQYMILKEKEKLLSERSQESVEAAAELKRRLEKLERQFTDTYTHAVGLERQIRRLLTYRHRIRAASKKLKARAQNFFELYDQQHSQNRSLTGAYELAEAELTRLRTESTEAQGELVSRFESQIRDLRGELEIQRRRAADRESLFDAKIRIENQLVFEERQGRQYREETQKDLSGTKQENADLRVQLKTRLIEIERLSRELEGASREGKTFREDAEQKFEQIESLQLLWREKQSEVERSEEKNRALQKLNQQLSVNLNDQRKEIAELKLALEKQQFSSDARIRALEDQL